jgi:multiple sugar transport system permease protein
MATSTPRTSLTRAQRREERAGWLMALPSLILLGVFMVVPTLTAFYLAFTNQRLVPGPRATEFVGFTNFIRLFQDEDFFQALRNNFEFTVIVVPLQCALALALALLINQKIKGVNFFRTIYFSPIATTMVVVGVIWTLLFNPEGFINTILNWLTFGGVGEIRWLVDQRFAMTAIIIVSIWSSVGFQMIIFLAGLQEIDKSLFEAGKIDGANVVQRFRFITFPSLRNTIVFVLLTTTILAFRLYTQVQVMTQGGPRGRTETVVRYMVEEGFGGLRVGYAAAINVVFLLIILAISMIQQRVVRSEKA